MAQWKPGQSGNPKGRRNGSKNHFSQIKQDFLEAFQRLGGIEGLVEWLKEDDSRQKFFYDWVTGQ